MVEPAPGDIPTDLAGAERIVDAIAPKLGPIGAFKLGATIAQVRATLGLPRQFFGTIPQSRIYPDGGDVPFVAARQRGVESEYAFRLARDLTAADAGLDEAGLIAAIDTVHPSIEIPGSRFVGLGAHGGFGLVADVGAVGSFVVGPGQKLGDPARLTDAPVILEIEGSDPVTGGGAVIDGGPFGPLLTFVRTALARGYALKAGQFIASGSCTGYIDVPTGTLVTARFPALDSSVSMRFAAEA
ncbi:2-keto-4-pentenoate hydratase [Humitalea sp. 24SJ18S-53]|uniref:2-keto-4-pentenoate hydratase n=1 Tax=Humitalea sp. 24SJ18S-53 TaxID=3422307 RepID=UPI003D6776A8